MSDFLSYTLHLLNKLKVGELKYRFSDDVEYKQPKNHLPMHSRPALSRVLPTEHVHTKDPWLFTHSPLIQGLDSHSFTSMGQKNRHTFFFVCFFS